MNVAFYVASSRISGGGFQYEFKAISLLYKATFDGINIYIMSDIRNVIKEYKDSNINIVFMQYRQSDDSLITFEEFLSRSQIDLVYFLTPTSKAKELVNIPYIMTVWDLCHRDFNEFPEVRNNNVFESRELMYSALLKKAVKITTDSKLGRKNICHRYGIDEKRVEILKFLPRELKQDYYVGIKDKYKISRDYIYYPAQFWAHKNHIYILKAIKLLKEEHGILIDAVFSGTDYGNLEYVMTKSKEFGLSSQIHYLGFVDDIEIPSLYTQSLALVMPTYFGPTNIPPLEGFMLSVPVCYSDLDGMREQVGEAAFLMDLKRPTSLVEHLIKIIDKDDVVDNKIKEGHEVLKLWTDDDFLNIIKNILVEYKYLRECWA